MFQMMFISCIWNAQPPVSSSGMRLLTRSLLRRRGSRHSPTNIPVRRIQVPPMGPEPRTIQDLLAYEDQIQIRVKWNLCQHICPAHLCTTQPRQNSCFIDLGMMSTFNAPPCPTRWVWCPAQWSYVVALVDMDKVRGERSSGKQGLKP